MSQVRTGLFQHREDITIKGTCVSLGLFAHLHYERFGYEVSQWMLLDLEKPYLLQEFIKTHQAMSVHKKKGWLHLPAVSRGLADSQHSLCATTPSPEGTWRVLSHLSVRATRAHPTLKEFIAGSHIHLKTCICGPDTQSSCMGPV